jgi:16S rRNA G966 N2-methylase RsmD
MEAVSRGASYLEAVESDRLKRKTLIDNTNLSPVRVRCHFMAVELYIRRAKRSFDYIFCDPPFGYQHKTELIDAIGFSPLMNKTSLLMFHRPKTENYYQHKRQKNLLLKETRFYGNSAVDFLEKLDSSNDN